MVKTGAAAFDLHDGPVQVMLISSVKDVAFALNNLIAVTKAASGKPIDHPEMKRLKESAKVMVTNVTSLLRTVKTIEDKAQQGRHALEITIESIGQQLDYYHHHDNKSSSVQATPEDLIIVTKQVKIGKLDEKRRIERKNSFRLPQQHRKRSMRGNRYDKKILLSLRILDGKPPQICWRSVKPV